MKKYLASLSFFALALSLNAATVQDILAYQNIGDTSEWYHELIRDAYNPKARTAAEKTVLDAMKNPKISDDAFRLCAKIMKPAVTDKSVAELLKLANKPSRIAPIYDILITAESSNLDGMLINVLRNSREDDMLIHAAYVLGRREAAGAVVPLWELVKKSKPVVADTCVVAIGHIPSADSSKALAELVKSKKGNPFLVDNAIAQQREMLIKAGKIKEAYEISTSQNFRPGLLSLVNSQPNAAARMKFLDKNFVDQKLLGRYAARIANSGRTFDNSGDLIKAYPKLEGGAKVAAVRSFALSGDGKFFDVIKGDVTDSGELVNIEAIFACAYIAPDSAIPMLEKLLDSSNKNVQFAATYSLTTMPSAQVDKALLGSYAKNKNVTVLDILLNRGNQEMRAELFKRMFDVKDSDRRSIVRIFENQVGFGGLQQTIEKMKKADDNVRKDALGAVIKFVMKDPNSKFRMQIFKDYFENSGLTAEELELAKSRFEQKKK